MNWIVDTIQENTVRVLKASEPSEPPLEFEGSIELALRGSGSDLKFLHLYSGTMAFQEWVIEQIRDKLYDKLYNLDTGLYEILWDLLAIRSEVINDRDELVITVRGYLE